MNFDSLNITGENVLKDILFNNTRFHVISLSVFTIFSLWRELTHYISVRTDSGKGILEL